MDSKVKQTVKFYIKLATSSIDTLDIIRQVKGNAAVSRSMCFEWHTHFKNGRTPPENNERSGRAHPLKMVPFGNLCVMIITHPNHQIIIKY